MALKEIKNWSVEVENGITSEWKKSERFRFNSATKKKIFSIDTPPPYINAPIHLGHATTYCYMDFFARYKRMKGFEVIFPLGLDRNGLPIEVGAEKKFKISPFKISREKFLGYCKRLLEETSLASTDTFARLGISFNNYEKSEEIGSVYFTDDESFRILTQATFVDLFKRGLVYEDSRINNWDSKLQTTIADSEIDYEDIDSNFVDVKWKVKDFNEEIIIGTTRPELICSCGAVIFNPDDERYQHLEGKTAVTPIFGKEVPIMSHPFAKMDKGTGLVMMCSAGDLSDIQFFREKNLKSIISIGVDGRMNDNAGFLKGLKVKESRQKMIDTLKEKGLIVKEQLIKHRTPISERSKVEVEFIEMPEYYVKQLEIKEEILKKAEEMNFYPESSRKILKDWIDSISIDWPVSRRRFYATEIPLWYAEDKKLVAVPRPGNYYQPWKDDVPEDAEVYENGKKIGAVKDFKDKKWIGEERVFDTWFDSSVSSLRIINYSKDKKLAKKFYPITLRPQGKEIVRTWLYYSLLRCYYETGKMPFEDVWIHNHILDERGIKMSKSLGNVINPQELINDYGAEAFRLWAAGEGDLAKQDLSCSRERINAELKTINKLLNVSKFVMLFEKPEGKVELTDLDRVFIRYLEMITNDCDESYNNYDFHNPVLRLRHFIWDVFASNYIELVKSRVYNSEKKFSDEESKSARYTLHYLLERFLVLIYPVIPQVTSVIAKEKEFDIFSQKFPEVDKRKLAKADQSLIGRIIEFNSQVWRAKKNKGISLRNEISGIKVPCELKEFEKDFKECHKLI